VGGEQPKNRALASTWKTSVQRPDGEWRSRQQFLSGAANENLSSVGIWSYDTRQAGWWEAVLKREYGKHFHSLRAGDLRRGE